MALPCHTEDSAQRAQEIPKGVLLRSVNSVRQLEALQLELDPIVYPCRCVTSVSLTKWEKWLTKASKHSDSSWGRFVRLEEQAGQNFVVLEDLDSATHRQVGQVIEGAIDTRINAPIISRAIPDDEILISCASHTIGGITRVSDGAWMAKSRPSQIAPSVVLETAVQQTGSSAREKAVMWLGRGAQMVIVVKVKGKDGASPITSKFSTAATAGTTTATTTASRNIAPTVPRTLDMYYQVWLPHHVAHPPPPPPPRISFGQAPYHGRYRAEYGVPENPFISSTKQAYLSIPMATLFYGAPQQTPTGATMTWTGLFQSGNLDIDLYLLQQAVSLANNSD